MRRLGVPLSIRTCICCLTALLITFSTSLTFAADDDAPKKDKGKGKLFEKMDTNKDGKISKEEFAKFFGAITKNKLQGKGDQLAKQIFAMLDANKDGFLSKEEFAKFGQNASKFGKKKKDE